MARGAPFPPSRMPASVEMSIKLVVCKCDVFNFFGSNLLKNSICFFSVCSVCTVCSLHTVAQVYLNCAPGALVSRVVCSSSGRFFKQLRFAHCVHTHALGALVYTISFMMSTLNFFAPTLSAATAVYRVYCTYPEHSWSLGAGPPTASMGPSPMNGTICRFSLPSRLEECVVFPTGRVVPVGARSSTSICGL
jgi:hypothetical protein